eukprot:CCRYP_018076-RB/>CCRYP_018076-RB protein AED:0.03 eAED:0.03 QI:374/1/1/1/0.94/0.9/20/617/4181
MKTLRLIQVIIIKTLFWLVSSSTLLRGQQHRGQHPTKKAAKSEMIGANVKASLSDAYKTVFFVAENFDRRVPDNAPINANQDAYAALLNKRDVLYREEVELDPSLDDGNPFTSSPKSASGKRAQGVGLMFSGGINEVIIQPEEILNDCDADDVDSSTCLSLKGGSVLGKRENRVVDKDYFEELHDEHYYLQELHALTQGGQGVANKDGSDIENPSLYTAGKFDPPQLEKGSDRHSGRRLTTETRHIGIFKPLECNAMGLPTAVECDANPDGWLSSLVASAGSGKVVVPCGKCIKYDLPTNATSVIHGLDIHGKLYIPPNYKSTLRTTFVFVQGELQMSDTNPVSPDNTSMKIILTGTNTVTFTPADSNANVTGTPFDAGFKPFLVAGGRLDIRGWDIPENGERVATWTPLLASIEGQRPQPILPVPNLVPVPIQPDNTTRTCPRAIVNHNFTESVDYSLWSGGEGAIITHDADKGIMVLSNIHLSWQGFRLDFTKFTIDCPLQPNVDYLLTARLKIDKPGMESQDMPCKESWYDCPVWTRKIILKDGTNRHQSNRINSGSIGKYGEWFTFMTVWRYSNEDLGDNVAGNIFFLENNEPGAILSMDEFAFELPSSKSFAKVDDTCAELVVNGNAESSDGHGWAFYPMWSSRSGSWSPTITKETQSNGSVNKFYRASNRKSYSDSIRFNMVKGCFVKGMTYQISLRIRVSSVTPLSYYVRISGPKSDGSAWIEKIILRCPTQSQSDGWRTCSGPYVIEADFDQIDEDIQFNVIFDRQVDNGPVWTVVDYDDISMSFMAGPAEGLSVDKSVVSRWGSKAEVHITSSTIMNTDSQNAIIESVTTHADGRATIKLETGIDSVLSDEDVQGMGVEVVLLSRNIKIEGEAGGTALEGGYFQVFHTPGVAQTIEGVEFTNMGQQQGKNRFALHFLYSGDVPGTLIARNSIVASNHRCVVIEGSSNITIEANVAYDTAGHCFYIGSDARDNTLLYNIGSRTNDVISSGKQLSGESDHDRATFQLYNPRNDYIGNVAAGSDGRGFGIYNDWRTFGEDNIDTNKGNIRRLEMKLFRANKAHSNAWQGFLLYDYEQFLTFRDFERVPLFENIHSYRNQLHGIYAKNVIAAEFIGGILADNQWGFFLLSSDGVLIDGMTVKGYTDAVQYITTPTNRLKLCSRPDWSHEGIRMMTKKDRYSETDPNRGLRLKNVAFSDFDKNTKSCLLGSWPISFSDITTDSHFDYTSSMQNVTVSHSGGLFMDACTASSKYGIDDIVINDLDGALIASIEGTSLEDAISGVFVSNTNFMKFSDCIEYASNCLAYCPGLCLRTVTYAVEQFGTEGLKLLVTNDSGDVRSIPGKLQSGDYQFFSHAYRPRKFSVSLPSGTYTARFIDEEGNEVWPTYVEELWDSAPDCAMSASPLDITLLKPKIHVTSYCNEMIRNGGQSELLMSSEPWAHTGPGVQVGSKLGINLSDAIVTVDRGASWTGVGQSIDSRCIDKMRGHYVEFSAWIRMFNKDGSPATNINPDSSSSDRQSPQLTLNSMQYRDVSTKEYIDTRTTSDVAQLARPYKSNGWNLVHGIFRLPSTPHLFIEVDSAPTDIQFHLDDVSMIPFNCDINQVVRNGNLEEFNITKYWDTWGEPKLDIVRGYGEAGNAVRASLRTHSSHGPAQVISLDCNAEAGDRLLFSARMKFESGGVKTTCDINTWDSSTRCSDIFLYTSSKNGVRQYNRVGQIITDPDADGWYHAHGVLVLNENHIDADYAKVYFDGTATSRDVIVDNLEVKVASQECSELVLNPSIEDSSFWSYIDRGRSMVSLVLGAQGGSDLALRSYGRSSSWRGLRQQLDTRCFFSGAEYEISAKFRLVNSTTSQGVLCDTNVQTNNRENTQCPSVVIYGWGCDGDDVYWRFWNNIPLFEWNPATFNDFRVGFIVDDSLASCDTMHVYIHQVNQDWDIIMDDLRISAGGTQIPSFMSTNSPTDDVPDATGTPTSKPTYTPTVETVTKCPLDGSDSLVISPGPIMLGTSDSLCILTKASESADGLLSNIAPVARSFNGRAWERSSGEFATQLLQGVAFEDYSNGTQITLPELPDGAQYYLTSYSYDISHEDKIARLLESATFGTTAFDLTAWDKGDVTRDSVGKWIQEQISKPMTSHREFFRSRVNPRLPTPRQIGRPNHPCDSLSRWRKFTFSKKDGDLSWFDQYFSTSYKEGDSYITIKLNGHIRTVLFPGSIVFDNVDYIFEYNKEYEMCGLPEERISGRVFLRMEDESCQWFENPVVTFYSDSIQPPKVLILPNISESILEPIDEMISNGGEFIYFDGIKDLSCDQLNDVTEQNDSPIFGKLPDGSWLQYDPRLRLEENNIKTPIVDGGGLVQALTGQQTRCANVPRTFLNEQDCTLSFSSSACGSLGALQLEIELNDDNIASMHDITGQYVYSVLGLPVIDFQNTTIESPCTPGLRSRWEVKAVDDCPNPTTLQPASNTTLFNLLNKSTDKNPFIRDISFPTSGYACGSDDTSSLATIEIIVGSHCFKRVHPEHMSVFDFTYWTLDDTHPGNIVAIMEGMPNPIKKWTDVMGTIFLMYPSFPSGDVPYHPIERWNTHSVHFSKLGRFGDVIKFVDLPNELRTDEVADYFGESASTGGEGIIVCGSPNESANDPSLGYQFDVTTGQDTERGLEHQREYVWTMVGLNSDDQLRQRVAWALSQLLVIVPSAIGVAGSHTEAFLTYYDIFVRNAFGNYGDILREIAFNPLMAENLSFLQSKSAAYMWETQQKVSFADENFAREIMQLFSTGLYALNIDGTPKLDDNGEPILVYTNDEIMSFARIWTGFDYQPARGNVEDSSWSGNRHDPLRIQASWRDKFPKSNLLGGYIGDGYPLCVDLPSKMFLRRGAVYRLLGTSSLPELMEDDWNFKTDPTIKKFTLDPASQLKATLCNPGSNGSCQFSNSVTLESNLICVALECAADTLRVVEVSPGIHYEYVSPPCVEQVVYPNAKKVINRERWADSSCANPLLPYASEACCSTGDLKAYRSPDYLYDQERVTFSTAESRCHAMGKKSCDFNEIRDLEYYKKGYHWSTDKCLIKVKVNAVGHVALVYEPDDYAYLHPHIDIANRNYFKVYWEGEYPLNDNDVSEGNSCGGGICESLTTGGCLCGTMISRSRVFKAMPDSADEVLSKLTIGAFDPSAYDNGTYAEELNVNGVTAYLTAVGSFNIDTVFAVTDSYGRIRHFKNSKEYVRIIGAPEYTFRNAPSFLSVLNTEAVVRDALYETEAALEHYLYHDNTAPFLAIRLIQRFTTSNPTPNYVKAVAMAFQQGKYDNFGSGKCGDLEATIAAIFLEPEARATVLNADPFMGGVREPLLRVMALMRSMELRQADGQPIPRLYDMHTKIGMMAHSFPTVFSFYLPEYIPDGRPRDATLVSPEAQIMDMPKTVGLLNGFFSMIKYGLSNCNGGFGNSRTSCREGNFVGANAYLSFSRPFNSETTSPDDHAEALISELSTLLTSGRLSTANKQVIKDAYLEELLSPSGGNADSALRLAQQLIVTAPEFHTTNSAKLSGKVRNLPEPPQTFGSTYKAIVYVLFAGGCDSFNMLVPHTCRGTKDMYAEYAQVREEIAIKKQDLRVLAGTTENQVCETFGVHPKLEAVQRMYNDGDLLFFANTGVLTKETDKQNYGRDTVTQLFAHNWMQREAQRVDPLRKEDGTGILGRIADALTKKGLNVGSFAIDVNAISLIGTPGVSLSPFILSRGGVSKFNYDASSDKMDAIITSLNGATTHDSGVFGDLWSSKLVKSLSDNKNLYDTLADKTTNILFPKSQLGGQLEMVAKMIDSRIERGTDADMFFLQTGGWDTHADVEDNLNNLFEDVDASFEAFASEMKNKGIWESVTVIETSDFARTLSPNTGRGSDHAWGGNYMMFGGDVKGRQIVGTYPENITDDGNLSLGRGRMIPTTSWDAVFLPLAEWTGVESSELDWICPNRNNFPASHFIDPTELFDFSTGEGPTSRMPTTEPTIYNPTAAPTRNKPTATPTSYKPTVSPDKPTTATPTSYKPTAATPTLNPIAPACLEGARIVKIELGTGENIHLFEVNVFSSGADVAKGKPSVQSSTLTTFLASRAVDGNINTFSHTDVEKSGSPVWWEVDLGAEYSIELVTIINRWCKDSTDPSGCLCRLSFATLLLIDGQGSVIASQSLGNTCSKSELLYDTKCSPHS